MDHGHLDTAHSVVILLTQVLCSLTMLRRIAALGATIAVGSAVVSQHHSSRRLQELKQLGLHTKIDSFLATRSSSDDRPSRCAIVVGGGVAGVCTAYELAKRGFSVVVLEKSKSGPGTECSAVSAGGAQRMNVPFDRDMWHSVIFSFVKPHSNFSLKWRALIDPHFWRWGLLFTKTTLFESQTTGERRADCMLTFTNWAIDHLEQFLEAHPDFQQATGHSRSGAVKLLTSKVAFERASSDGRWGYGAPDMEPTEVLDHASARSLMPWLGNDVSLFGALVQTKAARANSEPFTRMLAEKCQAELDVLIQSGISVEGFETTEGNEDGYTEIVAILTDQGRIPVSQDTSVVIAAGSWTPLLLRTLGLFAPVYPLKGYSGVIPMRTLSQESAKSVPDRIVAAGHVYWSPLSPELRFAGIGELNGWDTTPDAKIAADLKERAAHVIPGLRQEISDARVRCGLRPFTSDGAVLLGHVEDVRNLYVNVGPGFNGWKLGLGTGAFLAALVDSHASPRQPTDTKSKHASFSGDWGPMSPTNRIVRAPLFSFLCG